MKQREINEHSYLIHSFKWCTTGKTLSSFGCFGIIGDSLIENICLVVWIIGKGFGADLCNNLTPFITKKIQPVRLHHEWGWHSHDLSHLEEKRDIQEKTRPLLTFIFSCHSISWVLWISKIRRPLSR